MEALSKEQHTANIRRLIEVLRRVPEDAFDMHEWGFHEGDHAPEEDNNCGTSACALGWAVLDPKLQAFGIKPTWVRETGQIHRMQFEMDGEFVSFLTVGRHLFGLNENESHEVFMWTEAELEDVVARLTVFAKDREELRH